MRSDDILLYIWLGSIIPAAIILLCFKVFEEPDGSTLIDLRKIIIFLCGVFIGNFAIVAFGLWIAGMLIVVKIGEWLSPLGDITFYDSRKKEEGKWWETNEDYKQMCKGITSQFHCREISAAPEQTIIDGKSMHSKLFRTLGCSDCEAFRLNFIKTKDSIDVYSIDFYDQNTPFYKKNGKAKLSVSIQGLKTEEYEAIIRTVIETGNFNINKDDILKQKQ